MLKVTISGSGILGDFYLHFVCLSLKKKILQIKKHGSDIEQQNLIIGNSLNLSLSLSQAT